MTNVPTLSLLKIAQIEAEFINAYPYENRELDNQLMLQQLISYSFADKVMWLADRPDIQSEANEYYKARRQLSLF